MTAAIIVSKTELHFLLRAFQPLQLFQVKKFMSRNNLLRKLRGSKWEANLFVLKTTVQWNIAGHYGTGPVKQLDTALYRVECHRIYVQRNSNRPATCAIHSTRSTIGTQIMFAEEFP